MSASQKTFGRDKVSARCHHHCWSPTVWSVPGAPLLFTSGREGLALSNV